MFDYLCRQGLRGSVLCFAVTEQKQCGEMLTGLPINFIDTVLKTEPEALVIVAVAEKNQRPMLERLKRQGFNHILRMDGECLELLRQSELSNGGPWRYEL